MSTETRRTDGGPHGSVGDNIPIARADWSFGGAVPENFVAHVRRSVPGYDEGHELACRVSDFFVHRDSVCYELGPATGELLRRLAEHHAHKPAVRWIGIDRERSMVARARAHCDGLPGVEVRCDDVVQIEYEPCDLVVAYYTIQFVEPRVRQTVFDRVYAALNWGGAFVLFEKTRGPDARFQDILTQLYVEFKRRQGFSGDEILDKAESLKGVLEPFTTQANIDLLRRAGFTDVMTIYKNICFEGLLAIK
jgi:tRNA (cmo5U34)-methyltransferase